MEITPKLREVAHKFETPFVVLDLNLLQRNYERLQRSVKNAVIFYAVKANSNVSILETLKEMGSCFDVASRGEIEKLLSLNISASRMSFGNPIKREEDIAFSHKLGINYFSVDSEMEIEKVARNAPGSRVYGRIQMSSVDSDWPLSKKFGTDMDHVKELMVYSKELGLIPYGISFHVGSQTYNKYRWKEAIMQASDIFLYLQEEHNIHMQMLNLGGGIPIQHKKPIPSVEEIGEIVDESIETYFDFVPDLKVFIEPGRSMVGDIGTMVSSVLLRSRKQTEEWVYLDAGVFHGLMETIENFRYEVVVDGKEDEEMKTFTLAGPTCDSVDMIYQQIDLPASITYGDIVYFKNTGAYTVEYGTYFNGIRPPKIYILDYI